MHGSRFSSWDNQWVPERCSESSTTQASVPFGRSGAATGTGTGAG